MPRPSIFKSALLTNVLSASFFLFPLTGRGLEGGLLMQENKMVYELKPFRESSPRRMSAIGGDALLMGKTSRKLPLTWGLVYPADTSPIHSVGPTTFISLRPSRTESD